MSLSYQSLSSYAYSPLSLFFFNDTATTEIYTLSLHDALPIFDEHLPLGHPVDQEAAPVVLVQQRPRPALQRGSGTLLNEYEDRKSTRLNSSHQIISYAVFCLKKKNSARFLSTPE